MPQRTQKQGNLPADADEFPLDKLLAPRDRSCRCFSDEFRGDNAWDSVTISEPGFEADGAWRVGQTGSGTNGFFGQRHKKYISAVYHNIREFTARVLVAASSWMPLLSVPEPIQA